MTSEEYAQESLTRDGPNKKNMNKCMLDILFLMEKMEEFILNSINTAGVHK